MILTTDAIRHEINQGRIVVSPFEPDLVSENSIDIRLGADLWQMAGGGVGVRDIYRNTEENTDWLPEEVWTAGEIRGRWWDGAKDWARGVVHDDDQVFLLRRGRFYIGTTVERIGTRLGPGAYQIVPEMRAKSTTGRHGLTVALCAGLGETGYCSRWALEIRVVDDGPDLIPVAVNTVIGQCVFHYATATDRGYGGPDRYQKDDGSSGADPRFLPKALKVLRSPGDRR